MTRWGGSDLPFQAAEIDTEISVRVAGSSPRGNRGGARTRFRPRLDALEARTMLSNVVTVTNDHDSGTGSLRAAINSATSGEIIEFAKSAYGTITLTSGPLQVNAINLTIQGPGANKLTINGGETSPTSSSCPLPRQPRRPRRLSCPIA